MSAAFEFLFKYRPFLYEKGTLAFRPHWSWTVTLLLVAGAVAASYLLYRRTAGALPVTARLQLAGLRALGLLILLIIFLQPVLILHSVVPQMSFIAVAYDSSKSMEIRDGDEGQSRLDIVKHLLRPAGNPLLDELGRKFKLRFFRFSGSAERVAGFEDLPRRGNITDLERTLGQIVGELGTVPISGIVLITDGADNHSTNLSAATAQLRARNIPVYPVGVGSPDFSRDVEVLRASAPRKVLKNTMIEADVSVRSTGYAGRRAKLVVMERDRILQSQEIRLGSDGEVKTHKVNFSADTSGPNVFTFRVEPFPDEIVSENNDQTVLVRVEDDQPQILYTEGEPRWIYGFLRRAALEDKNVRLVTLLRQADGKFLRQGIDSPSILEKGFPTDKTELFHYKALILGSVEASFFTFDQLRLISDFVSQRGGGFLMLGGKNSFGQGGYVNTPLEDVLPVGLRFGQGNPRGPDFQDIEYRVRLTGYGAEHPVTRLSLSETDNRKRWDAAPTLQGLNPTAGPKAGATVLAQGSVPDAFGKSPVLLAFQRFGRGKSMALTTGSTWRWRMGLDHRDNFHELFWKQMLRWLVSDAPDPVGLMPEKHSYSMDEPVVMHAEVNDLTFMHLNNAEVTARVKSPSGEMTTLRMSWDVDKDGQYTTTFKPREEGIYEVTAEARQGTTSLGSTKANFRIADTTEEFHSAALNPDLLKRLASETGGRYYTPRDARTLPQDISYVDNGVTRLEEKDLWDMPFLFLLLVATISAEWIFRKRKGLA
ncbi:MAG TPA: glutamine amidotransferase [Acidobacteriota bacterium]|nr:glutamine amidotransferase [Acidobacteriota bacterium]